MSPERLCLVTPQMCGSRDALWFPCPLQNGMGRKTPSLLVHHFALLFAFTLGAYLVRCLR